MTRARATLAGALLLLLATLATAPTGTAETPGHGGPHPVLARSAGLGDFEERTLDEINEVRVQHGLDPIRRVIPCLDELSETWGHRIAAEGLWEHRDMSRVVRACRLSWTGEALARGTFTPRSLVAMWMASPPHRAILLTPRARLAGIDVRRGPGGQLAAVLNLGDRG
ncbi:CAP domain-containing protein [Nocardioides sp. LHG3406-4]|uniref:CAP domain-containing protein n=1 Tax=Nocardioides sp. LHG3406-4 TaxID=2804575 RepID=UPI003CEF8591